MDARENRYAHLLEPIRDLTRNWEIDVASELNDYLEELDDLSITYDGGKTTLNFAEAALLIQGSTCIYSKKVELLHNLVYQTLEYISDRNRKGSKEAAAAAQEDDAGRTQSGPDSDSAAVFVPVDLEGSETSEIYVSNTVVNVIPLPPESLILPETHEKHKLPLISVNGEVLCSQKDFRTNLFIPGEDNLILLGQRSGAACRFLLDPPPAEAAVGLDASVDAADHFLHQDNHIEQDQDHIELDQNHMDQDHVEHIVKNQASDESVAQVVRQRHQVDTQTQQDGILPEVNLWRLHDPYSVIGEDKPFKSGKCYTVPAGLDDGGKRKRKEAGGLQDFRTWFRGTVDPPEHRFKTGPTFTDLNYIYLENIKDKVKQQKRINRSAGVLMSEEELRRTLLEPEETGLHSQWEEPVDEFRHADLLGDDDDDDDNDPGPSQAAGGLDLICPGAQEEEVRYEELVKCSVEQLVLRSQAYTQETELSRRVKEWKEKMEPLLQQQEERPPMDIRDYSERIVTELSSVGGRRTFSSIVRGLDSVEVSKYLLASLHLANDYKVELDAAAGLEDSLDTMSLTLLSTQSATDRFKTLTADSPDSPEHT